MAASVRPLTLSLKVTVTVAVSPAARWVLSNVALMGTGALVSISKLLLVGLTVAALPAASRMGLRLRRLMVLGASSTSGPAGWGVFCCCVVALSFRVWRPGWPGPSGLPAKTCRRRWCAGSPACPCPPVSSGQAAGERGGSYQHRIEQKKEEEGDCC